MEGSQVRFLPLAVKTAICHTITYMCMGMLAFHFLHYAELLSQPNSGMRAVTSPWVIAGPLFQPLRGVLFALVFYPFREVLFGRKYGWLLMSWTLIALGILGTFGPAGGSMEGMIYTPVPVIAQMRGWLEIVPQAVLLSALLCYWVNHPGKKWLSWVVSVVFVAMMAMSVMGLVMQKR